MKFEDLIKENKEKFTQTDFDIVDFLINNKNKN